MTKLWLAFHSQVYHREHISHSYIISRLDRTFLLFSCTQYIKNNSYTHFLGNYTLFSSQSNISFFRNKLTLKREIISSFCSTYI